MHHALNTVVRSLPVHTEVWCGHEYTIANLKFALTVEPHNVALQNKLAWAIAKRAAGKATIPSSIVDELTYNPFMRVEKPSVREGGRCGCSLSHG
jgi:hydroxyacylglutathione hydrolase